MVESSFSRLDDGFDLSSLAKMSASHLRLLHAVDTFPGDGGLYRGPALQDAVRRYERCWLPLFAEVLWTDEHQAARLVPPLDVAWVWHLHRMHPAAYCSDCERRFQRWLTLRSEAGVFRFSNGDDWQGRCAKQLWEERFPDEPFYSPPYPPFCQLYVPPGCDALGSGLSHDVAAAAARQAWFLRQVLRLEYTDAHFLKAAAARYRQFLLSSAARPDLPRPPAIDVHFMWRTHASMPATYQADCHRVLGRVLDHDHTTAELCEWRGEDTALAGDSSAWGGADPAGQRSDASDDPPSPSAEPLAAAVPHPATSLLLLPYGFLWNHAESLAYLRALFGPRFAADRGGALALVLLNSPAALETLKRFTPELDAALLPHSSQHGYWTQNVCRTRDVNRICDAVALKYLTWRRFLAHKDPMKRPSSGAKARITHPRGLCQSFRVWHPHLGLHLPSVCAPEDEVYATILAVKAPACGAWALDGGTPLLEPIVCDELV